MTAAHTADGYDIRSRHPERENYYQDYRARSERLRSAWPARLDLRYGAHPRARLDIFAPHAAGGAPPLLAFVHGGFWHAHDKSEFAFVAEPYLAAGIGVALVNYPLAPETAIDGIVAHVAAACRWLAAQGGELGFDPDRIVVAGHSAGAHLALSMLSAAADAVAGAIGISGIYDLRPLTRSIVNRQIGLSDVQARDQSPALRIAKRDVPVLLAVGGGETQAFRDQTNDFAAAWRKTNPRLETIEIAGANHYDVLFPFAEPAGTLADAALRLLRGV